MTSIIVGGTILLFGIGMGCITHNDYMAHAIDLGHADICYAISVVIFSLGLSTMAR
jgi:hypothetical protein